MGPYDVKQHRYLTSYGRNSLIPNSFFCPLVTYYRADGWEYPERDARPCDPYVNQWIVVGTMWAMADKMDGTWLEMSIRQCSQIGSTGQGSLS